MLKRYAFRWLMVFEESCHYRQNYTLPNVIVGTFEQVNLEELAALLCIRLAIQSTYLSLLIHYHLQNGFDCKIAYFFKTCIKSQIKYSVLY